MARKINELHEDVRSALEHVREADGALSPSVLFALSGVSQEELHEFAETWMNLPAERRRRVALALTELAEENIEADFNRLFRYMLNDEDPEVRAQAIDGLWEDESANLINPLIGSMRSDASARVRAAAAQALGRFVLLGETHRIPQEQAERIREALLAVIRDGGEDPATRRRAIESIAYIGDETVRDIITAAFADDDALMRASAVFAMGRTADPYWRRPAAQELWSPDPQIRFEAARAVGELEYKVAVPRLIELLEDADPEVQSASITSLGQIGGKEAREALVQLIESEDEVASEIAHDALDELEFSQGSELLLYDMGLSDNELDLLGEESDDNLEPLEIEESEEEE